MNVRVRVLVLRHRLGDGPLVEIVSVPEKDKKRVDLLLLQLVHVKLQMQKGVLVVHAGSPPNDVDDDDLGPSVVSVDAGHVLFDARAYVDHLGHVHGGVDGHGWWCGVVWFGLAQGWFGVVWFGLAQGWFDVVWRKGVMDMWTWCYCPVDV